MKNCITINTKKDSIVIKIDENAEQDEIMQELNQKLIELKKLYKEDDTPITVAGKVLKNKEIDQIQEEIKKNINVKVFFDSPRILGLHGIKKTFNKDIATSETKFHKGALRSGQRIEFEGSLVILGDVNDGAEVIASENIVVLGALRGLAHAGAKGNNDAMIAASSIESQQIRISNVVKEIERDEINKEEIKTYAYLDKDCNMVIE
ncbi:MAG: septum site-determining protein MinC [Christensenellales bacterium]